MLLNRIWIGFFLVAIVTGLAKLIFWQDVNIFKDMVVEGLFESAKTGFELSIYMTGALCMCLGFMNIGEKGGAVRILSKAISPLFTRVFPEVPKDHPAVGAIMMNFSANMLGLDNADTPMGLKAMKELQELNPQKDTASNSENILQVFEERKQAFMAAFDTVIQERKDLLNERLGLLAEESKKDGDFLKEFFENEIEAMRGEFLNPETGRLPLSGNAIVEFQKVLSRYEQAVPAEKRKSAKSKKLEIFIGKMKTDAESFPGVSPEREPGETVPAVLEEEKEQKAKDIADFGLAIDDYQGVLIKGRESF